MTKYEVWVEFEKIRLNLSVHSFYNAGYPYVRDALAKESKRLHKEATGRR